MGSASAQTRIARSREVLGRLFQLPAVLFSRHRLAIMLELCSSGAMDYLQLRHDLRLKDGALATHLKALMREGLIKQIKERIETREATAFTITREGIKTMNAFSETIAEVCNLTLGRGLEIE